MLQITIVDENGLHARPASELVSCAKRFADEIYLVKDGQKANAKSIMSLMGLGIMQGDTVEIEATGPQADSIERSLADILTQTMDVGTR